MPRRKITRAGGTNSPAAAEGSPAVARPGAMLHREGEYWTVGLGSTVARMRHSKGLSYISFLLQHPGAEFHVLDLVAEAAGLDFSEVQAVGGSGVLPENDA